MIAIRLLVGPLLISGLACAAGETGAVAQAANRVDQQAAKAPQAIALEFRMLAAQSLQQRHPDLARKFIDATLEQLRAGKSVTVSPGVVQALAVLSPSDAASLVPKAAPEQTSALIVALALADHLDAAAALFRGSFTQAKVRSEASVPVLGRLAKVKPAEATQLFREIPFDAQDPPDAWALLNAANAIAAADPKLAADACERVLTAASAPHYGEPSPATGSFKTGAATIATANARDTLLVAAGSRLRALAPERLEKYKSVLAQWDLSQPVTARSFRPGGSSGAPRETASIRQRMGQMRGLATDADRARVAIALAEEIRALPAGAAKLDMAGGLCSLSTEGDLGKDALAAVAATLAAAMREGAPDAGDYMELASLARYEHVPAPAADPALEAAMAVLALREQLVGENGFTLTAMDGKAYNLDALRGRVVLLNFWATWCPPCRKEMPDMEKLYQRFAAKGLTVLAVSDEERDTVAGFLQKQHYTFPVLLDPGRKVHAAFNVEGIPKSFLFDRGGKLVAQAIDMRTGRQFLEMLKQAGLE